MVDVAAEIAAVAPYTKSGPARLEAMAAALECIDREGIPGDVVECGVWRGGNIILARKLSPSRVCWLYDTFSGMTRPEPIDRLRSGAPASDSYEKKMQRGQKWAGVSVEEVRINLAVCDVLDDAKCRFVAGPVEETLLVSANLPERIALARLDTDWYRSTKIELVVLYPLLSPGGILVVDDFGHWLGCRKAVEEYFGAAMPPLTWIDYTAVSLVKPCAS